MPRRFVRPLTPKERGALRETYRTSADRRLAQRAHAILLSASGKPIPEIAALLLVDQSTIHRWLDRFEAEGLEGVAICWSPGPTPRWDEAYELLLVETVRHNPRWYGLEQSGWTCPLLAGYLAQQTGITLSAERVRVLLHQHGLRLKQPTLVPPRGRDPQYHPKGCGRSNSA